MNPAFNTLAALAAAALLLGTAQAHTGAHADKPAVVKKEQKAWGIAGDAKARPGSSRRTIEITMGDDMRFVPDRFEVRQGETVRLVIHNRGKLMHEFVLGTKKELDEHAALMVKFPNMEHDEPYMAHVPPGRSGEIVWTFNRAGEFDFACLIAGHYQAGMVGKVKVVPAKAAEASRGLPMLVPVSEKAATPAMAEMADGEVRKIDKAAGKLTLRHGEIKSLDMPPMTMVFAVKDKAVLERLKAGDKVRFKAVHEGGVYTVTQIEAAK
jgi:uncharacterized cupredoxin-like copper-binding protein/Cu/Ag efflux protein CusF